MNKTEKGLLIVTIVCLAVGGAFNIGLVDARGIDALYAILPMGAVFAGLLLIVMVLGKETALYDQDHPAHQSAKDGSTQKH